jgi:hypothetical protein
VFNQNRKGTHHETTLPQSEAQARKLFSKDPDIAGIYFLIEALILYNSGNWLRFRRFMGYSSMECLKFAGIFVRGLQLSFLRP